MPLYYILDENKNVVPVEKGSEWAEWFDVDENRVVEQTDLVIKAGDKEVSIFVSTIFRGLNTSMSSYFDINAKPTGIFETMAFRDNSSIYQEKHDTWAEAVVGHQEAIETINSWEWHN
jgi:hypothetical protein